MGQRGSILAAIRTATEQKIEDILLNENYGNLSSEVDSEGRNALHIVASEGRTRVASLLIRNGFLIDTRDIHGNTALHMAVFKNHEETAQLLIESNADVNSQDVNGMTPLHWAVQEKNVACVELLVRQGANLQISNKKNQTPLDLAMNLRKNYKNKILSLLNSTENGYSEGTEEKREKHDVSQRDNYIRNLCSLWGLIKYTHPYLGYRKDINWDKALLDSFISILEATSDDKGITDDFYFEVVHKMLLNLKDLNTYIEYGKETQDALPKNNNNNIQEKEKEKENLNDNDENTKDKEHKPLQNYELIDNVAVLDITKFNQFEHFTESLNNAMHVATALVVDVRCPVYHLPTAGVVIGLDGGNGGFGNHGMLLSSFFEDAFRNFLVEDLVLPTRRQSLWHGHPEYRSASRNFLHGMVAFDAETILAPTVPHVHDKPHSYLSHEKHSHSHPHDKHHKPMIFILNKNTPQRIINFVSGLQVAGYCSIVYHVDPDHVRFTGATPIIKEPGIRGSKVDLGRAKVIVRQNEILNPDNSIGFNPDLILIKGTEQQRFPNILNPSAHPSPTPTPTTALSSSSPPSADAVIHISIALALKTIPASKAPVHAATPMNSKRPIDHSYPLVPALPPVEFRLLALARLWNAIDYFYTYKNRLANTMVNILARYIPRFISVSTELDYSLAVSHFIHEINDSNAYVHSDALNKYLGTHIPPLYVKLINNSIVILRIHQENQIMDVDLKLGDIITSVDGEAASERINRLKYCFSYSTGDPMIDARFCSYLLSGEQGSTAVMGIRRVVKTETGEEQIIEKEIVLLRTSSQKLQNTNKTAPPFAFLKAHDHEGLPIGYIDLRVLGNHSVPETMETFISKSTQSLIIDLRGTTKDAGYRLARHLTNKKVITSKSATPFFMPSLVEGVEPSLQLSNRICVPIEPSLHYSGKVVALIDNTTIGHAELTAITLKACRPPHPTSPAAAAAAPKEGHNNLSLNGTLDSPVVFIGSPTSGTVGSVTNLILPGNVEVGFVGLGYLPAQVDGGEAKGITPDILVYPTIESIIEERDLVLEAAIHYLQNTTTEAEDKEDGLIN